VKEFRSEIRGFDWAEFRNVSLRPGRTTEVLAHVVRGFPRSPASPKNPGELRPYPSVIEQLKWQRSYAMAVKGGDAVDLDTGQLASGTSDLSCLPEPTRLATRQTSTPRVRILSLPDARNWPDAAIKARGRVKALMTSPAIEASPDEAKFFAVLTSQSNLVVAGVRRAGDTAIHLAWAIGPFSSEPAPSAGKEPNRVPLDTVIELELGPEHRGHVLDVVSGTFVEHSQGTAGFAWCASAPGGDWTPNDRTAIEFVGLWVGDIPERNSFALLQKPDKGILGWAKGKLDSMKHQKALARWRAAAERFWTARRPTTLVTFHGPNTVGCPIMQSEPMPYTKAFATKNGTMGLFQIHKIENRRLHFRYRLMSYGMALPLQTSR